PSMQTLRGVASADINLDWASKFIRKNSDKILTSFRNLKFLLYRHKVSEFLTPLRQLPRKVRLTAGSEKILSREQRPVRGGRRRDYLLLELIWDIKYNHSENHRR
ncbi:MAG: hypothetical protein WC419_07075, partial [Candidatus Omnitrophota bacterium]